MKNLRYVNLSSNIIFKLNQSTLIIFCQLILFTIISTVTALAQNTIIPPNVICDNYTPSDKQCVEIAQEVQAMQQKQFDAFLSGDFLALFAETDPNTSYLLPNGEVAKGFNEIVTALPALAGSYSFAFSAITNQFTYRPLDRDTVIVSGPVNYTLIDYERNGIQRLAKIVNTVIYRRDKTKLLGWKVVHEQFSYSTPLDGPYRQGATQFYDWGL